MFILFFLRLLRICSVNSRKFRPSFLPRKIISHIKLKVNLISFKCTSSRFGKKTIKIFAVSDSFYWSAFVKNVLLLHKRKNKLTGAKSYFREAIWKNNTAPRIFTTHPKHNGDSFSGTGWHWYDVEQTWTFDNEYIGVPIKTDVSSMADEIVFLLNGNLITDADNEIECHVYNGKLMGIFSNNPCNEDS